MRTLAQLEQMLCNASQLCLHATGARRYEARRVRRGRQLHLLHLLWHPLLLLLNAGWWDLHHHHAQG
jgi:hypothetical protein